MLFLIILFMFINTTCASNKNAGTALFINKPAWSKCWSENDIARLRARKTFEELVPPEIPPDKIDDRYIKNTLKYFKRALRSVDKDLDRYSGQILKEALLDTIGAHLSSEILPNTRFAYYAGYVHYRSAREIHDFLDEIKTKLNTRGIGWQRPERVPQWSNLTVAKIVIGVGKFLDPCACLVTKRDSNSCIHLPLPKLDDYASPSALALPFQSGGLINLVSPNSENILLKYYTTASRCILHSSPKSCRHSDFVNFNNEMWHWMKRDVAPHLVDEHLYAAYGGVLRLAAAVQNYGKGLSRRNLFDLQSFEVSKWHPWKALTQSYIYVNADWTPKLYICLVLLAALAISLLQICYNYMFGVSTSCRCRGLSPKPSICKEVEYTTVDTNIPAMLPHESAVYFSDKNPTRRSSKTKMSLGSVKTQKVYDLNENAEKIMAVIVSDNEDSNVESSPSKPESDDDLTDKNICDVGQAKPTSPPKLETSISHLKFKRSQSRKPMYSSSTVTQSDVTYCDKQASESVSSETGSSISGRSVSSTSSKSRTPLTRSSRDLAWARRVISQHTSRSLTKTTSGTELDLTSFTTPPSHR